jgi:hypothetical protein
MREGESPDAQTDVEVLFDEFSEPIDLEIDVRSKILHWMIGEARRAVT